MEFAREFVVPCAAVTVSFEPSPCGFGNTCALAKYGAQRIVDAIKAPRKMFILATPRKHKTIPPWRVQGGR
jgi:hypothetical protein